MKALQCLTLLILAVAGGVSAQVSQQSTPEASATVRPMQVGDRYVYRFHNKGDKHEPVEQWQQVLRINGSDAWMYAFDGRANITRAEWLIRWDQKRAKSAETFNINLSNANGQGSRIGNFQPFDDAIQLPVTEGKTYKVKWDWNSGNGYDEYTMTVGPLKKHTVTAGEFWAYEVVGKGWWNCTRECTGSGRLERREVWSPEIGRMIRQVQQSWNGRNSLWNNNEWELTQWQPAVPLVKDIAALAAATPKTPANADQPAPPVPSPAQ